MYRDGEVMPRAALEELENARHWLSKVGHIRAKAKSIIAKAKHVTAVVKQGQSLQRKSGLMHGIGGANETNHSRNRQQR